MPYPASSSISLAHFGVIHLIQSTDMLSSFNLAGSINLFMLLNLTNSFCLIKGKDPLLQVLILDLDNPFLRCTSLLDVICSQV
jgi:hypothetical protein